MREKKSVSLISAMHNSLSTDQTRKKKPLVIHFYNKNKIGVDVVDQMLREYSAHTASRRWPLAVWTNILDTAVLNTWILFTKVSVRKISRRNFILDLIESLRNNSAQRRLPSSQHFHPVNSFFKRRKCAGESCVNPTKTVCKICLKHTCGKSGNGSYKVIQCKSCN